MAYLDDVDQRFVKRNKFGPLDVYPQEERQKEDELNAELVKSGFKYVIPELLKENEFYGLKDAKEAQATSSLDVDVLRHLTTIVNKREEANANSQTEASKKQPALPKQQQTYRPSLILVTNTQKSKEAAYAWFKQLAGNDSLAKLSKKIPNFNKRLENLPEIFITLYEYQVPITRAVWYFKIIVLSSTTTNNDANRKKRATTVDTSSEISLLLVKFLREIFNRLQYFENHPNASTSQLQQQFSLEAFLNVEHMSSVFLPNINYQYFTEQKLKCLWLFSTKLMRAMLDQNLLDKQCILETLLDLLEKSASRPSFPAQPPTATPAPPFSSALPGSLSSSGKAAQLGSSAAAAASAPSATSTALMPQLKSESSGASGESFTTRMLVATILQNMHQFLQSEILSRRLAYFCCRKIANMFNEYANCFFEATIKQLQQQHQTPPPSASNGASSGGAGSSLLTTLPVASLLLSQQKSPEMGGAGSALQLTSSSQPTTTTPPTKLKPFVTNLPAAGAKPPATPTSNKLVPFPGEAATAPAANVNEVINYKLVNSVSLKSMRALFEKFLECPKHRDQLVIYTSIVHSIQLGCMQALIWNDVGDGKTESPYNGSPLDLLPCPPSRLLFTYEYAGIADRTRDYVRNELERTEICIKRRSLAVENKWCTDRLKQTRISIMQTKILKLLDVLDKHCYVVSDISDTMDSLYKQIFAPIDLVKRPGARGSKPTEDEAVKSEPAAPAAAAAGADKPAGSCATPATSGAAETTEEAGKKPQPSHLYSRSMASDDEYELSQPMGDKDVVHLLCDWATTTKRYGLHRIFYAVFLIKKRQLDWIEHLKEADEFIAKKMSRSKRKSSASKTKAAESADLTAGSDATEAGTRKRKHKSESETFGEEAAESKKMRLDSEANEEPTLLESTTGKASPNKSSKTVRRKLSTNLDDAEDSDDDADSDSEASDSDESDGEDKSGQLYEYLFQKVLFEYLESKAIVLDESSFQSRLQFANLVALFHMFINCKLFSHDRFVCTLISRGETFRNSMNDIKKPAHLLLARLREQQARNKSSNPALNKRQSIDYHSSPMSVYPQPASMPAYHLPPHTPLQHQKSFGPSAAQSALPNFAGANPADPFYNAAPLSVPTPSKMSSNSLLAGAQLAGDDAEASKLPPPLTRPPSQTSMSRQSNAPPRLSANNPAQRPLAKQTSSLALQPSPAQKPKTGGSLVPLKASANAAAVASAAAHKPMSKLAQYVLHIPIPQTQRFQHERNQRFVVLYGFGAKRVEIQEKIVSTRKSLLRLFARKASIDLAELPKQPAAAAAGQKKPAKSSLLSKLVNRITNMHYTLSAADTDLFQQLNEQFARLDYYDQYSIVNQVQLHVLDIYKTLEQKNFLPKLQYLQYVFDLMESSMNIFNMLLFAIRLLRLGPTLESYLRRKLVGSQAASGAAGSPSKTHFFEYLSAFYLNLIGVFRLHLVSLCLWRDLATVVFKCLLKLVRHVEKPSKCSTHEKCAFMLMTELYSSCSYIKQAFQAQFEPISAKIKAEKCFNTPSLDKLNISLNNCQMRPDDQLTMMITTTDYTLDEIEAHITSKGPYNFVAHAFVCISNMNKEEMLRVANLCSELTCRNGMLTAFWHNATKALFNRNQEPKEKFMFNELLHKINIQNPKSLENFKFFLSVLAARHCFALNEFIIIVVKTCVMACPGIMNDQGHNLASLEPSASLACHLLHFLFTSAPRPLVFRNSTFDQRMLAASFRSLCFNSFLLVLKGLFLLSDPQKGAGGGQSAAPAEKSSSSGSSSKDKNNKNSGGNNGKSSEKSQSSSSSSSSSSASSSSTDDNEKLELDQFAANVLQEICEHDWIRERCFNEGDNLLKPNQLLEPALGRRAQNLLHIICYPQNHHLRKLQNEQCATKDFIKHILQTLDIWTLRESLLEFKLMIELQKTKDSHCEYFIECLAKTTVDFLIDPEKQPQPPAPGPAAATAASTSFSFKASSAAAAAAAADEDSVGAPGAETAESSAAALADTLRSPPNSTNNLDAQLASAQSYTSPPVNAGGADSAGDDGSAMELGGGDLDAGPGAETRVDAAADDTNATNMDTNADATAFSQDDDFEQRQLQALERELEEQQLQEEEREYLEQQELEMQKYNQPVGIWLIAPLITKLQNNCQIRILETASRTLQEMGKQFLTAKTKLEKETQAFKNITAWTQQPFFALLTSCLKVTDDRRPILTSLFNGLSDFITFKEDKILSEDPRIKQIMMETLPTRLSLVGSMFDFILQNQNDFINWAWLFVQLIFSGVIDPDNDQLLFTMILDMLAVLIHHIITLEPNLESNRYYQTIIKKISKETKDFGDVPNTKAINHIRRLMPLNKQSCIEIIQVDSYAATSSKNQASFHDKRKGFKFARKEKVGTWELIEGVKNTSSLCLSWYGATKLDRKMLRYDYQQKLLVRHKHMNIYKELSFFKEKPQSGADLPADFIEVVEPAPLPPPPAASQNSTAAGQANAKKDKQGDQRNAAAAGFNTSNKLISSPTAANTSSSSDVVIVGANGPPGINGNRQQSTERKQSVSRTNSTPDKQKNAGAAGGAAAGAGSNKKQRPSGAATPRGGRSGRGGFNATTPTGSVPTTPTGIAPIIPPPNLTGQPQHTPVRSTNSPMLMQNAPMGQAAGMPHQQQPGQQQFHPQMPPGQYMNAGQVNPAAGAPMANARGMPPVAGNPQIMPNQQGQMMPMGQAGGPGVQTPQPGMGQMNPMIQQKLAAPGAQANPNFMPNKPQMFPGQTQPQQLPPGQGMAGQAPPMQYNQQQPGQMQQRGQMMSQQAGNRGMNFAPAPGAGPAPVGGPAQVGPSQAELQQRKLAMAQQQQQQQQQQGQPPLNRMLSGPPQTQPVNQFNPMVKQQSQPTLNQPRTTTPDPNVMMNAAQQVPKPMPPQAGQPQQQGFPGNPNPNYMNMQQQQQQQQQRMQQQQQQQAAPNQVRMPMQQAANPGMNPGAAAGNMQNWQQQQQRPGVAQQRPQFAPGQQPQHAQFQQQQQQFMQKPPQQGAPPGQMMNPGMQQQQQQAHMMQQQQRMPGPPQQQQQFPGQY